MKQTLYMLPLVLVSAAGPALADDAALLKCRALTDLVPRVACYDAIPVASLAPPVAPSSTVATPAAAKAPEQDFGLTPPVKKVEQASSFRSTVVGAFDGWAPGTRITLANGQVWRVSDNSEAVLPPMQEPQVEVSRGLLGAFFLQVVGRPNTARVVRVQ
ncbi:hypothetical protein [Massilia brevitalea]|uniref:hypothetical protein n=1 Tax=Massilia brevitalea TaxID=442526 RepID=UPI002739BE33|nr:hypothetical protein [Massilia brevitalea]